ncbi:MAG: carbohydrate kinase family protein [candidate division KSB1 bacterium]|nr:carbohydrate kinase family protein [candidate division KSB1 bacterium]
MAEYDVVCLGLMLTDILAQPLRRVPDPGRLELVDRIEMHTGGCALNTGLALARLGARVAMMGLVGEDGFGDFVLQEIRRANADWRSVRRTNAAGTSATVVLVSPEGERSFVHTLGANALLSLEHVDFDVIARSRLLHIGSVGLLPALDGEPMAQVLRRARELGVSTSLDTVWDPMGRWLRIVEPCLPYVDLFLPALHEARAITGLEDPEAIARFFLNRGPKVVAVKMGDQGCLVTDGQQWIREPAYAVNVVDTTGAGDAFVAGFLMGWLKAWPLQKVAQFANAVGAMCVTAIGATQGVRSLEETLAFMDSYQRAS